MSESVFERLLGSYSGMRKRTWSLQIIEEGSKWWKGQLGLGSTENDPQAAVQKYQTLLNNIGSAQAGQGQNTPQQAIQMLVGQEYGAVEATTAGIAFSTAPGEPRSVTTAKIPDVTAALEELIAGASEEAGDPKKKKKDGAEGGDGSPTPEELAAQERIEFSPGFTEDATPFLEELGVKGGVVGFLSNLQNKINTPNESSKIGRFVSWIMGDNPPEISKEGRKALSNATEHLVSIAQKVRTVDGKKVIVGLTGEEREALKIITVRNNGSVYFGRPGEAVPGYEVLQENASEYGDSNYGFSLGNSLDPLGAILKDAKIVPEGVDIENVSAEDLETFDSVQKSKAGASSGNDAIGKLEELVHLASLAEDETSPRRKKQHLKKLKEALEEFGVNPELMKDPDTPVDSETYETLESIAQQIEDNESAPIFLKNLLRDMARGNDEYKRALNLQEGDIVLSMGMGQESIMSERADTVSFISPDANLDTTILQGNSDQKVELRTVGKVTIGENGPEFENEDDRELFTTLALARVRDRYTKKQWAKLRSTKKGKAKIALQAARILQGFPYEKLEGTRIIGPSIKNMQSESDTARTGSVQASKMYGSATREVDGEAVPTGRDHYDGLVDRTLDREIGNGVLTDAQKSQIKGHIDEQRDMWQEVEDTVGNFNSGNTADFTSFIDTLIDINTPTVPPPAEDADLTVAGRRKEKKRQKQEQKAKAEGQKAAKKQLGEIKTLLNSKSPTDVERGKLMLFQLKRVARAQRDPEFARSVAVSDLIGSFTSKGPEPMYINQRSRTLIGNNHAMTSHAINEAMNGKGRVEVREARTQVYAEDGSPLFGTRRVSRKGKSPQIESEMAKGMLEATLKPIGRK